jgi:hypothetical protein
LRPVEPLVVASQSGTPAFSSNLIDADKTASRAMNIAGIPRPSSPSSQESLLVSDSGEIDEHDDEELTKFWPCTCGTDVPLAVEMCPSCGSAFLSELRGADAPQRRGPSWLSAYLDAARPVRLAIAGAVAFAIAVGIPGFLMLFS